MRKKRQSIAPDLTPVIDIVFILLIFFMVTSVFKKEDVVLALNLPSLDSAAKSSNKKIISLELTKDSFAIDSKIYLLKNSSDIFANYKKDSKIEIRIDEEVSYSRVMELFNILQKNSLTAFSLVAQKEK